MSSEIYEFDGCFFNDQFLPFNDSILQEHNYNYSPLLPSSSSPPLTTQDNIDTSFDEIDQITTTQHSSSPPSNQLESVSLYNQMGISVTSSNETLCNLEVKTEESQQLLYDNNNYYYGGPHDALKMMQRSYSSNSFHQKKSNDIVYQPKFNGLIDSQNLHSEVITSPDYSFSSTNMRRVCSTGDLQVSTLTLSFHDLP